MILITLLTIFLTTITSPDELGVLTTERVLVKAENAFKSHEYAYSKVWYHYALYKSNGKESQTSHAYIHYKLAELYYRTRNFGQATHHIREAIQKNKNVHIGPYLRYHLGRSLIMNKEHTLGELQLIRARMLIDDPVYKIHISLILARLHGMLNNIDLMALYIAQALEGEIGSSEPIVDFLSEAYEHATLEITFKSESKARKLSTVVPGLGQLYARRYLNSISALLVNSTTTALLIRSIRLENYHHSLLIGSMLWWRYYDGNRDNAVSSVFQYNNLQTYSSVQDALRAIDQIYKEAIFKRDISLTHDKFEASSQL